MKSPNFHILNEKLNIQLFCLRASKMAFRPDQFNEQSDQKLKIGSLGE